MTTFCLAVLSLNRSSGRPIFYIFADFAISALLLFTSLHSGCVQTGVQSGSPYLLLSNVNEPVSLPVRIIMPPVIHVGQHFMTHSTCDNIRSFLQRIQLSPHKT